MNTEVIAIFPSLLILGRGYPEAPSARTVSPNVRIATCMMSNGSLWWQWENQGIEKRCRKQGAKSVSDEPQSELRVSSSDAESVIYNKWQHDGIFPLCLSSNKENVPAVGPADITERKFGSIFHGSCRKCQGLSINTDDWRMKNQRWFISAATHRIRRFGIICNFAWWMRAYSGSIWDILALAKRAHPSLCQHRCIHAAEHQPESMICITANKPMLNSSQLFTKLADFALYMLVNGFNRSMMNMPLLQQCPTVFFFFWWTRSNQSWVKCSIGPFFVRDNYHFSEIMYWRWGWGSHQQGQTERRSIKRTLAIRVDSGH